MAGMTSASMLLTLPSELMEAILICSCSPRTVASIAQTCQTLHTLVYASPDSHLWRELFLAIWDDPHPAFEHRGLVDPRIDSATWDWGTEYRRRVSAERWLKAWRRDICLADDETPTGWDANVEWYTTALSALTTVLNTLLTLQPFPAAAPLALTTSTPVVVSPFGSRMGDAMEPRSNAPLLPPLLTVLAGSASAFQESRSGVRVGRMMYGPHASRGFAAEPVPTPSLPPQLVRTLLASHIVGVRGLPGYVPFLSGADHWRDDPLGDIFHRIICITGFVPIPPPLIHHSMSASTSDHTRGTSADAQMLTSAQDIGYGVGTQGDGAHRDEHDRCETCEPSVGRTPDKIFPTPSQQHADARILARRRVYDMRYLRADRLWGPFHSVTKESLGGARPEAVGPDNKEEDRRGWADTGEGSSASSHRGDREQTDTSSNMVDASANGEAEQARYEHPFLPTTLFFNTAESATNTTSATSSHRRTRRSNPRLPPNSSVSPRDIKPQHLRPDYAYLASVRIIVEENLREIFNLGINDSVEETTSKVGPGEVGMFWEDEDEILRQQGSSKSAPSLSRISSPPTRTPSIPVINPSSGEVFPWFRNLEVARLGSACGYWGGWTEGQKSTTRNIDGNVDGLSSSVGDIKARKPRIVAREDQLEKPIQGMTSTDDKGKRKERYDESASATVPGARLGDWEIGPEGEVCEGWDWAGVSGTWRRCVCWMDYRELLFFNVNPTKFLTVETQEEFRIIPMELQVTEYTRAGLMPVHNTMPPHDYANALSSHRQSEERVRTGYFRPPPIIHFSGSFVGSDGGLDEGRIVKGSVQLIGGGEVRWRMETYMQVSNLPGTLTQEWSSEAVQIGGIGSAVGILGMWTGAGHERGDPLGPFWAWKVA